MIDSGEVNVKEYKLLQMDELISGFSQPRITRLESTMVIENV